jgi:hypothetical protein
MLPSLWSHPGLAPTNAISRRTLLRLGGLTAVGALAGWPRLAHATAASPSDSVVGKARSCILLYLLGGPPHLDMWDLKPTAPPEIRGPFRPIETCVPGIQLCEHLPRLARLADKFALLRAVSHPNNNHTPMIYYTLTGRHVSNPGVDNNVTPPQRTDFPHIGAAVARLKPPAQVVPGFIALPELTVRSNGSQKSFAVVPLRGGRAGFLGATFDPLFINDDPRDPDAMPGLSRPTDVTAERAERRRALLNVVERGSLENAATQDLDALRRMAVHLTGAVARGPRLFSLDQEEPRVRERYGTHRFGQSMLLARRFVAAGVPTVAIHFNKMTQCDGWDTHGKNFESLKGELLPLLDQSLSALLEDLDERGLLQQTVVVCMGEFGRTPTINPASGRDHWGHCQTALLAGGGIRGGQVCGASDKNGAYPRDGKVDPVDIHATVYHCLGIDPEAEIHDQFQRPHRLCLGRVVENLFA